MRRRFFVDQFVGGRAVLGGDTAHHLGRVLRAEPGQLYELSDGSHVWLARIEEVDRDRVEFSLVENLAASEESLQTTLLLSVVKFDAFEFALEKATELGVSAIIPVAAARSEKALLAAAPKRAERWMKILLEASQQSRRVRIPQLAALTKPETAFSACCGSRKILLSERPDAQLLRGILDLPQKSSNSQRSSVLEKNGSGFGEKPQSEKDLPLREADGSSASVSAVALAIGPEGGWTEAEFESARRHGFCEASLGGLILRAETAVIAALASLNYALSGS